ncbi:putative sulfate exporter family transporter [Erythrobacter sp. F6033]|uniref:YeiH family protein n=1 Tax=Erythrobacter sp. F6033 TaxID=2926401 RepID=UPI001FF1EF68|nr:putative sulfate exporter family transporter [Erythrobacter sp. F6033]MCK0127604.1 putative sulfate exporter family transporter [Erythrobacter sp. F6033]
MTRKPDFGAYYAGDLYGEMTLLENEPTRFSISALFPGLLVAAVVSLAAAFLSQTYGIPLILAGLLLGLSLSFLSRDTRTHPGLDFASKTVLRGGIALLGLQVTLWQIAELGAAPFAALAIVMIAAIAGGLLMARLVRQPSEAGLLAGGATAICGVSAALALYGVIGQKRVDQGQFAVTLVGISLASAAALSIYPTLAIWLNLTDAQAGFLTGAAIHDVAQAIGGGFAVSDQAGAYATVVKLARVALLAPLVACVALILRYRSKSEGAQSDLPSFLLPGFIVLFLAVLTLNSFLEIPQEVQGLGLTASKAMLLLAVTATAMRSRLELLLDSGWRSVAPILGATVASLVAALLLIPAL